MATYSIVAVDPDTQTVGIGVQSKFLAAGAIVPWVQAGVGAVATQAMANTQYGPRGLALLQASYTPDQVIARLTQDDEGRSSRQMGVVSISGKAAAYTGDACTPWAGHIVGDGFTCQGNILASEEVVAQMVHAYQKTGGDLVQRLLATLDAAQSAGGDTRGMQAAALVVEQPGGGFGGLGDRIMDLRVDDHPEPLKELRRLVGIHRLIFCPGDPDRRIRLEGPIVKRVQRCLTAAGVYRGPENGILDSETIRVLEQFMIRENMASRIQEEPWLDGDVYEYMLRRYHGQETEVRE